MRRWSPARAPFGRFVLLGLALTLPACERSAPEAEPSLWTAERSGALRAAQAPASETTAAPEPTTVVLVRHAEKEAVGDDPALTTAGRDRAARLTHVLSQVGLDAAYASQFRRTQETAEIVAAALGIEVRIVDARDVEGLADRLLGEHAGETVLVVGHSNTVPEAIRALGAVAPDIPDHAYDDLFVVLVDASGARAVHLNYGAESGRD